MKPDDIRAIRGPVDREAAVRAGGIHLHGAEHRIEAARPLRGEPKDTVGVAFDAQIVRRCLRDERYREIGVAAAISHPSPPEEALSAALANAGEMGERIEACFYQGLIPGTTTRAMLQCEDPSCRSVGRYRSLAGGCAGERRRGTRRCVGRAILRAPVGEIGRSVHDTYWIGEIMSADSDLAEEWLTRERHIAVHGR